MRIVDSEIFNSLEAGESPSVFTASALPPPAAAESGASLILVLLPGVE
jgi:hypothetical protein